MVLWRTISQHIPFHVLKVVGGPLLPMLHNCTLIVAFHCNVLRCFNELDPPLRELVDACVYVNKDIMGVLQWPILAELILHPLSVLLQVFGPRALK